MTIKPLETEEEIKGKAFVHWQAWKEAYPESILWAGGRLCPHAQSPGSAKTIPASSRMGFGRKCAGRSFLYAVRLLL